MKLITQRGQPKEYKDQETGREYFSISSIRKAMYDPYQGVTHHDAIARGHALHFRFAMALGAKGGLCAYPDALPDLEEPCYWMDKWVGETDFEPVKIEEPSVNEKWDFAGTPENLLRTPKGLAIIDLKTGGETKTDGVQLTLCKMLDGYGQADYMADLYLDEHGTQEVPRPYSPFDFACAMAALQVLKWRLTI